MNLLVGATGFVGGHVVEYLFQQGEISKGVFRKGSHLKILDANGVQVLEADLLDHHSLHEAMEGVDIVYNMASPMPDADAESDFHQINTEGLLNLLEVASEAKAKAFVHLSTIEICGFAAGSVGEDTPLRPSNEYQRSKAEAERLLMEFARRSQLPRVTVIRSAKAVGSRDESFVVPILRMATAGAVTIPRSGTMSFSHPKDIAQALFKAATVGSPSGSVYQTKSFDATMEQLAREILGKVGAKAEIRRQGMFSSSKFPRYATEEIKASLSIDDQKNWSELGYSPQYTLEATGEEIANWYRKEPWSAGAE